MLAEVLEAIATKEDKKIIDATIKAVKALSDDDDRLVIWEQNSHSPESGSFQIGACSDTDGVLTVRLGAFYFKTTQKVTRILWFEFSSSDVEFYKGGQAINLNEDIYSQIRQDIIDKLGDHASKYVEEIEI